MEDIIRQFAVERIAFSVKELKSRLDVMMAYEERAKETKFQIRVELRTCWADHGEQDVVRASEDFSAAFQAAKAEFIRINKRSDGGQFRTLAFIVFGDVTFPVPDDILKSLLGNK